MADQFLTVPDLRGGRSGKDVPTSLPTNQCTEAFDVDFYYAKCGNKRWGATATSLSGYGTQTDHDGSLIRHVPGGDEAAAELWTFNADSFSAAGGKQVQRLVGATWSAPTVKDSLLRAIAPNATAEVRGASFNGKLFLTYKANSAIDRLHVWDGSTVRRVGIAAGAAPTTSFVGVGSITDTRVYRVAWTKQTSGVTTYRSELTPASTAVAAVAQDYTIARPTLPGEGETHWEVYGYSITDSYGTGYLIATKTAATTAHVDATTVLAGDAPPEIGLNALPLSAKYIMVHGNRLLMAGSWEGGLNNRIWFTPPLGSLGVGDDERVPDMLLAKNRVDLDENDGGIITGFGGVINGSPIVFKTHGVYRLVPTGDVTAPYQTALLPISRTVGCIRQETVVMAEDEAGAACVYWLSRQGAYRYGARGLEYLGWDMEDVWADASRGVNAPAHGLYYPDKKQIWWWIGDSTTSNAKPNRKMVFHTQNGQSTGVTVRTGQGTGSGVRGGWVLHSGLSAGAYASVMYARVLFPTSVDLVPYISQTGGSAPRLWQCDVNGVVADNGTTYQSYITTPAYPLAGMGNKCQSQEPFVLFRNYRPAVTITSDIGMNLVRDFGEETISDIVTFTAVNEPVFKFGKMSVAVVDALVVQFQYGDVGGKASVTHDYWWGVEALGLQQAAENRV